MKICYMCVTWEGETYRGERKFYNYKEAYRYSQERLKDLAREEYMLDAEDPDDCYYYAHYFLVCELWKMTEKIDMFEQKAWDKEVVLYFYWTGRRVTFSSGKRRRFTFERIQAIEEALHKDDKEKAAELMKAGAKYG